MNDMADPVSEVRQSMDTINHAWRSGNVAEMTSLIHPDIVMKFPGFSAEMVGRTRLLAGFEEFCLNAHVVEYEESDHQINVIGDSAVVSFRFDMLYERSKYRERSKGRDLWVFHHEGTNWVAVWRTMVELTEEREEKAGRVNAA